MKYFGELWQQSNPPLPAVLPVYGLSMDSRQVARGDLFFGLQGQHSTGAQYLSHVQAAGAAGALIDTQLKSRIQDFPVATVSDLRYRINGIAANFFGTATTSMHLTGITGTNGKSSVCYWSAALFERLGHTAGCCGTLGFGHAHKLQPTQLTTPDAITTQKILADLDRLGCSHVFMEVSSHGLDQGRVEAVPFKRAVFTNLSHDHLDYHTDMASYWSSKQKLFRHPGITELIVNTDDPRGRELAASTNKSEAVSVICYGFSADTDVGFIDITPSRVGFSARFSAQGMQIPVNLKLFGRHSLRNLLAVSALAIAEGHRPEDIAEIFSELPHVPGRMQPIDAARGVAGCTVIVDYAHNPEALRSALSALREHDCRRLLCVFGCGGDRDVEKRPVMGQIASQLADAVWLTSDNPRSEDPVAILRDIEAGTCGDAEISLIPDRAEAVQAALNEARPGDLLLLAGKGHERMQIIGDQKVPMYDPDLVTSWLQEKMT